MKIFLLEDDYCYQKVIKEDLEDMDYEVALWDCFEGAAEQIQRGSFDLLIIDIELPSVKGAVGDLVRDGGIKVLEALDKEGITITIPTIFLTKYDFNSMNYSERIESLRLMKFGPDVLTYFSKPYDRRTFINNLIKIIKRTAKKESENQKHDEKRRQSNIISKNMKNSIRILHLSDLHMKPDTDPESMLQPIFADLEDKEEGLGIKQLNYLVITGDLTNQATSSEFDKAKQFIKNLKKHYDLADDRCIIIPGNHDLDWDENVYEWKAKRKVDINKIEKSKYVQRGDGILIRIDDRYPDKFKNFSMNLYRPIMQKEYPLAFEDQCIPFLFTDHKLLIMAMNSCWEIDEYFTNRSSIHALALGRGLSNAENQIEEARKQEKLSEDYGILKIAVWHHPVTGNDKIQDDAFLDRLRQKDFKLCLHGHVHENCADLIGCFHPTRKLYISGAGSFDSTTSDRPEAIPRLYNMLEIQRDHNFIRVHTRCKMKKTGPWSGWAVWPDPQNTYIKRTYYDIVLKKGKARRP
jgi:3',5'-cyclic AMP phosphodiesterase CpdA/CheY-like chemotaxis protein